MPPLLHGLGYRPQLTSKEQRKPSTEAFCRSPASVSAPHQAILPDFCTAAAVGATDATECDATKDGDDISVVKEESDSIETAPHTLKERKRGPRLRYTLDGPSPFPNILTPLPTAYQHIHDLLSEKHEKREMPPDIPPPSQSVAGCGEVNFVLEALIRTIISTHTHMSNADKAIKNVCTRYPVFQHGDFAGSVDWDAVRAIGAEELEEAIRPAGKAKTTSAAIMSILETVKSENDKRRTELLNGTHVKYLSNGSLLKRAEILSKRADEMLLSTANFLTLDYLHTEPAREVFERLQKFHGVGVKTAACILLFCFQYPAFAVDTHVWRLCKLLGWVPASADRDQTFFHLDPLVPAHLKYGLHQLFIAHGKDCVRCNGRRQEKAEQTEAEICVLESLVTRSNLDKLPVERRRGPKPILTDPSEEKIIDKQTLRLSLGSTPGDEQKASPDEEPVSKEGKGVAAPKSTKSASKSKKRAAPKLSQPVKIEGERRSKRIAAMNIAQEI